MTATTLINLISRFELKAVGHSTLEGGMVATFGINWDNYPEYREVANYVSNHMSYDPITGDWF